MIGNSSKSGKANFQVDDLGRIGNHDLVWKVYAYSYRGTNFAICGRKNGDYYHITMVMFESDTTNSQLVGTMDGQKLTI